MVKRCVVYNCDNTNKTGHTLHEFPKDEGLRRQWIRFVSVKRADFKPPARKSQAVVCEAHFLPQCYSMEALWMAELSGGALKRKKNLLPGSVPTVQPQCHAVSGQLKRPASASASGSAQAHQPETPKRSRASAKLEIARVRKSCFI